MQKIKIVLFFFLAIAFVACDTNNSAEPGVETESAPESKESNKSTMIPGAPDLGSPAAAAVKLDNGKKWKANVETTEGINKMMTSVKKAIVSETANIDAYRKLGASLQQDFNEIFQKCTMTGEAHDQLHNYLLPMVDMVKTFEQKDLASCEKMLPQMKEHLGSYYAYFE
ncbi:MAG: hypothetical protein DWQ02_25785 [Bacteroidetes bacterium]|nr:MAG: hypothetical protein DWQ02_25785 [Bacteroidota bacterium]